MGHCFYGNPEGENHQMHHPLRSPPSKDNPRGGLTPKEKAKADYSIRTTKAETKLREEDSEARISSALALRRAQQANSEAGMRDPATGRPLAQRQDAGV